MNKYKTTPRTNYMSLADKIQDCSTYYLINKIEHTEKLKDQMTIMCELEKRLKNGELSEKAFYNVLDKCNGK